MTLTTPYSATFIVGDGETKTFSYLFEEVSPNFISVMVYNSLTGLISTPTYIIDTDQKQVIFGEDTPAPTADETVCIYRNTPNVQDVAFRTLHGYDAQTLENILSKIVAMIQEIKSNYFSTQVLQGDPWQLDLLSSADDGATVNIDYTAKKLVKGLYFRITSGNLQVSADGANYITMPKSDDVAEFRQYEQTLPDLTVIRKLQYRVGSAWYDAEANAQNTADAAYSLASTVQDDLSSHTNNQNNPHQTSLVNLTDTNIINPVNGQFMMFDGLKWKNVYSSATASWGTILGNIIDQTDLKDALDAKVNIDGSSIMTAPLKFASGSMRGAVGPYLNGVSFWKMDSQYTATNIANLTDSRFLPVTTNAIDLGRSANKWKDLYLGGKAYVATLNNGADLTVPNKTGTLATMADVELAARSGRMLTDQGVWYAKMYSATVPPAAENGTNYADFSQVDGDSNPIIVIYERQSGAWVQTDTITPPADYDGYVPITSKIWDIAEQTGQQGGRILWNHVSKEFTPYPTIISFEDIEITGTSTVDMPQNPGTNQIVNKNYVDEAIASIPTPTVDIKQSIDAEIVGNLTVSSNSDISNFYSGISYDDYTRYLKFPGRLDFSEGRSFEIQTAITRNSSGVFSQVFITKPGLNSFGIGVSTGNKVYFTAYSSGAQAVELTGTTSLTANIKYYIKLTYDGSANTYTLSLSTDGVNYTTEATATSSYHLFSSGLIIMCPDGATLHMADCYIKYHNIMIWRGIDCPGLHQRVPTGHEVIAFQAPTSSNNYTWYCKYADGRVEQGGEMSDGATVILPVTMVDTHYYVDVTPVGTGGVASISVGNRTTTSFSGGNSQGWGMCWEVKGMYAQ